MKQIINVTVSAQKQDFSKAKAQMLALALFSDSIEQTAKQLDKKVPGIAAVVKLGDFKGKSASTTLFYTDKGDSKRVLLVGLGEKDKLTSDILRNAAATAANTAVSSKAVTLAFAIPQEQTKIDTVAAGRLIAEGIHFGAYRYDEYVTGDKKENGRIKALKATILDTNAAAVRSLSKGVNTGDIIGHSQSLARTIANRPGNVINPPSLAAVAKQVARETKGLTCTVLDEKQLKQKKMGGILAVGSGSATPPRLIILKYRPAKVKKNTPIVGLVGKAITFDSGGISIKPSQGMQDMKFDKSGGLAVLGTMKAVAELKLPIKVFGIIPSAENMPSGTSWRPGDIVTTFSKKTVEIQNTDAEGRMILCDGIYYAVTQKCDFIIDIATLTGACMVALGKYKAGLMSNDDELIKNIEQAAKDSGENVWHLPSGDEYADEMKSEIADLKNIGSRWGGACSAAAFLGQFAGDKKWAHIDMAGVDLFESGKKYAASGSTGYGVRLLTAFVQNLCNK
ncbi:MAG: leucyl aminopeptidase [Phycisphaerae bacterium]|nr:leucyl aminopeptidase [Phycisphaerae bacterium]